ncbi:formylmethanofuran dehydrogenase subunit C [Candidatus Thorarchaeota archaeon]|nr:MAG: formylmethanofuran dehydrogenase subunit C [Candidatus Thorarchaeota archaeon]
MTVVLTLKKTVDIPIEAEVITPTHFANKTVTQISSLSIHQGNQGLPLKEHFRIEGKSGKKAADTEIIVRGNLRKVKMIGKAMNGGKISVEGDAGMYLGAEMIAGRIHVKGSVDDWAAAEMKGGNIQIEGNAGYYLCAGYRGSRDGMQGGRVYVAGDVKGEMAAHMRKGFIAVKGNVESPCAVRMMGGTIIIIGNLEDRVGIQATKGLIICLGKLESILPTYKFSGTSEREFVNYYLRYLKSRRPDFLDESIEANEKWIKFIGDFAEAHPDEEIYVRAIKNDNLCMGD